MAQKKKEKGSGIQQAAGLIRYFDEESDDAWKISKGQVYFACIALSGVIYLLAPIGGNEYGVLGWMWDKVMQLFR